MARVAPARDGLVALTQSNPVTAPVLAARNAVVLAFVLNGFLFASLVSRIPDLRGGLSLDNGGLGLLLLSIAVGSILGLPSAGALIHRWSAGAVVRSGCLCSSLGLLLAAIWAAAVGQSAVAAVFGIFGTFWLSYGMLVLGLDHNWFAITATAVLATVKLFLVAWLVVILMLTLATLRLPVAFTAVFALVSLALLLLLLAFAKASPLGVP